MTANRRSRCYTVLSDFALQTGMIYLLPLLLVSGKPQAERVVDDRIVLIHSESGSNSELGHIVEFDGATVVFDGKSIGGLREPGVLERLRECGIGSRVALRIDQDVPVGDYWLLRQMLDGSTVQICVK